ncbi:MAG: hypothetical protein ACD_28C00408G0004 [uncultured bacterium]|nr:MAG: hypothetical protein ACD_28C00408G0004 [uncultured bacterium]KKT75477.1 MAG: hypothetical protein UW70_C0034G0024 [Candidatus Peregrinibacteria bacterium GW2011_GWA2_44_7]
MHKPSSLNLTGLIAIGLASTMPAGANTTNEPPENSLSITPRKTRYQEILEEIAALSIPCDQKNTERIERAKAWLSLNLSEVELRFQKSCIAWNDCPGSDDLFWSTFETLIDHAFVFCPYVLTEGKENKIEGTVIELPSIGDAGAYAIVGASSLNECQMESIMSHELAHMASFEPHEEEWTTDDWIYRLGGEVKNLCEES